VDRCACSVVDYLSIKFALADQLALTNVTLELEDTPSAPEDARRHIRRTGRHAIFSAVRVTVMRA
jgi:hypothetical protein